MRAATGFAGFSGDIVTDRWFTFIAGWTLRRSSRTNDFTALIRIHPRREFTGSTIDLGREGLKELLEAIAPVIRDTDLFGELADGSLAILVPGADEADSGHLVERISEALGAFQFSAALTLTIGFAVCPTHGVDVQTLIARAESHPALNVHTQLQPADRLSGDGADPRQSPLRESAIGQRLALLGLADSPTK